MAAVRRAAARDAEAHRRTAEAAAGCRQGAGQSRGAGRGAGTRGRAVIDDQPAWSADQLRPRRPRRARGGCRRQHLRQHLERHPADRRHEPHDVAPEPRSGRRQQPGRLRHLDRRRLHLRVPDRVDLRGGAAAAGSGTEDRDHRRPHPVGGHYGRPARVPADGRVHVRLVPEERGAAGAVDDSGVPGRRSRVQGVGRSRRCPVR